MAKRTTPEPEPTLAETIASTQAVEGLAAKTRVAFCCTADGDDTNWYFSPTVDKLQPFDIKFIEGIQKAWIAYVKPKPKGYTTKGRSRRLRDIGSHVHLGLVIGQLMIFSIQENQPWVADDSDDERDSKEVNESVFPNDLTLMEGAKKLTPGWETIRTDTVPIVKEDNGKEESLSITMAGCLTKMSRQYHLILVTANDTY